MQEEFDFSQAIGRIMSDPSFSKLVGSLKNEMKSDAAAEDSAESIAVPADASGEEEAEHGETVAASASTGADVISALTPLMSASAQKVGSIGKSTENRERLLTALKPYMSSSRREMIEAFLALSKVGGILDLLGKMR